MKDGCVCGESLFTCIVIDMSACLHARLRGRETNALLRGHVLLLTNEGGSAGLTA